MFVCVSILNITETLGNKMSELNNGSISVVAAALALSVVDFETENFYNLTFGVTAITNDPHPAVHTHIFTHTSLSVCSATA